MRFNSPRPEMLAIIIISLLMGGHVYVLASYDGNPTITIDHERQPNRTVDPVFSGTRFARRYIEDFDNYTKIDVSNTTSIVNTYAGKAYLSGFGSNPRSDIRDVSNPDRTRGYNRFTCRAVAQDGKFYIRDRHGSNTIHTYASLHDFMNNGNRINSFNLPFNPHTYCQMIYVNGHLIFSNGNGVNKYRISDGATIQSSLSSSGSTSWGWGGGNQCGLTTDGEYIYTYSGTTVRIYDMNENLLRQVNIPEQQRSMGTCFSAGHYFYPVGYSRGNMNHRVDADSGTVENYNDVCMDGFDYLTCFNYDYYGNSLIMTNGNAGNRPDTTWTVDNVCYNFGGAGGHDKLSYIQSKPVYQQWPTIGAARITWYESRPQGTSITYNLTVDGENWVTMQNGTTHVFENRGSCLMWNATLTTDDENVTPYIDRVEIEYDLFSSPQPHKPDSAPWQGTRRPKLEWNFTDPDRDDHQSDYHLEISLSASMDDPVYDSGWVNSTDTEHIITDDLPDGTYFWRVRTQDIYHSISNFSATKKFKIDVTRPVGVIVIEEGAGTVNEKLVGLAINATDNGSGVEEMRIINDRGTLGPWEGYAEEKGLALEETDGLKTIGVQFRDRAGIISDVFNDTVYLDLKGPRDISVSSSTHQDPELYYNNTNPVFQWEAPYEETGVKGYSYTFDQSANTEPPKVLYNQNGDAGSTVPGEFSGLGDGTWYFHITPCDEYDQWGNTTHFRFNIDTTGPVVMETFPEDDLWFNTSTVTAGAVFGDPDGSGLEVDTVQYSVSMKGGAFGAWKDADLDVEILEEYESGNAEKVRAEVELELTEGEVVVRWRCSDLAGNTVSRYPGTTMNADFTPVSFSSPLPEPDDIYQETMVTCGITISDNGGSGVNGGTIQYCLSFYGNSVEFFRNWTPLGNSMNRDEIEAMVEIEFDPGRDNYIMWRARDAVGNGFSISEPVLVQINSEPVPVIAYPTGGDEFEEGAVILLSANGSHDPDGDELGYFWEVKNRTTKARVWTGWQRDASLSLSPGPHEVVLWVDDDMGKNVSAKVRIDVRAKKGGGSGGGGGGGIDINPLGSSGGSSLLWWLIIGGAVLVLAVVIVLLLVMRKRKDKKKVEEIPPVEPQAHPYPWGEYRPSSQDGYSPYSAGSPYSPAPQYREAMQPYGAAGQVPYPQPGTHQPGAPQSYGTSAGQWAPALPAAPADRNQQAQQLDPALPAGQAPMPYALPPMATEQGFQDLNLMALPPAPEHADPLAAPLYTSPETPAGTTNETPVDMPIGTQMETPMNMPTGTQMETPMDISAGMPMEAPVNAPTDASPNNPIDLLLSLDAPMPMPDIPGPAGGPQPAGLPVQESGPEVPAGDAGQVPPTLADTSILAPMPTPEPAPEPAVAAGPQEMTMQCHSCGGNYTAIIEAYPALVQCPVCGTQGMLNG